MIQVRLTPAARKRLDAMLPDYYKRVADLMGQLAEDEKESLVQLLAKVNRGIPNIIGKETNSQAAG
jgi:DNA-binding MarR family transcriptional regulator